MDPNADRYSQEDAKRLFGEHKIESINVPATGLTKSYVDAVIQDHQEHLNRQQILQGAPSGVIATPLKFMANLAGNMADPGNIAIGLIPFVGEARAATLLGRAGQRFIQGSVYGAVQTAATMPLVADGQAAQGNDFTMGDYASNFLLGTIGGGFLHAGGGVVADVLRARDMSTSRVNEVPGSATEKSPSPENGLPIESPAAEPLPFRTSVLPDSPTFIARAPADDLARSIDQYRENYTQQTAYNDVMPAYADSLMELASRQIKGVGELQSQAERLSNDIGSIDASLPELTRLYQGQRMKFKEARAAAQAELDMASSLAGPFVGDVDQLRNLYLQARDGDAKAGDFLRFGINHTPFLNLLGVRQGMDYLILNRMQEWLSPGSLERYEQRVQKDQGNTFMLPPSQFMLGK